MEVEVTVNGHKWRGEVEPRLTLADFLRDTLHLKGTHIGCEQGVCGACTLLVDDRAIRSCIMFAVQVDGARVTTIEGLTPAGDLSDLQKAFIKGNAFQCGFCTPGFLATAEALRRRGGHYTRGKLVELLSGNVCRCTGYSTIVDAIATCLPMRPSPSGDNPMENPRE